MRRLAYRVMLQRNPPDESSLYRNSQCFKIAGGRPSEDADLALAIQMQEEENERQKLFMNEQSGQQLSYSQAAARPVQNLPAQGTGLQSSKESPNRKSAVKKSSSRPASTKNDAWKFWKW